MDRESPVAFLFLRCKLLFLLRDHGCPHSVFAARSLCDSIHLPDDDRPLRFGIGVFDVDAATGGLRKQGIRIKRTDPLTPGVNKTEFAPGVIVT